MNTYHVHVPNRDRGALPRERASCGDYRARSKSAAIDAAQSLLGPLPGAQATMLDNEGQPVDEQGNRLPRSIHG